MKTHSQTKGEKPFDWNAALAEDCCKMTVAQARKMYDKASTWVTCACGNQCAMIPRDRTGQPDDDLLMELGMHFTYSVTNMYNHVQHQDLAASNMYRKEAIKTLRQIERRSQRLIDAEVKAATGVLKAAGRLPK